MLTAVIVAVLAAVALVWLACVRMSGLCSREEERVEWEDMRTQASIFPNPAYYCNARHHLSCRLIRHGLIRRRRAAWIKGRIYDALAASRAHHRARRAACERRAADNLSRQFERA